MSTDTVTSRAGPGVDWRRAEFALTLLGVLGFITLPIRITTIYSGLPAHPLLVHVRVVLIPTTIVAAIVCVIKPQWLARYGIALLHGQIPQVSPVSKAGKGPSVLRGFESPSPLDTSDLAARFGILAVCPAASLDCRGWRRPAHETAVRR